MVAEAGRWLEQATVLRRHFGFHFRFDLLVPVCLTKRCDFVPFLSAKSYALRNHLSESRAFQNKYAPCSFAPYFATRPGQCLSNVAFRSAVSVGTNSGDDQP